MVRYMGPGGVEQDHPVTQKELDDWHAVREQVAAVARRRRVEVYQDRAGEWTVDLVGGTGAVTESLGTFASKSAASRAARKAAREDDRVLIVDGEVRDDPLADDAEGDDAHDATTATDEETAVPDGD